MAAYDAYRGLAIGYIVAIVVCVVFFFIIVPILGLIFYKKRKSRLAARNRAAQRQIAAPPPAYPMVNYAAVPATKTPNPPDQQFGGYYAQDGNIVHEMPQPGQQPYAEQRMQTVHYSHEQPYVQAAEQRNQQNQQYPNAAQLPS